jgi:hypothetical protein
MKRHGSKEQVMRVGDLIHDSVTGSQARWPGRTARRRPAEILFPAYLAGFNSRRRSIWLSRPSVGRRLSSVTHCALLLGVFR